MADQAEQPARLPHGRHRLSREQVSESQRGRMLIAICEEMAERGYVETSVAAVIARAGVSRETFYEHFDNKLECFLTAFDAGVETLTGTIAEAMGTTGPALERLDRGLAAYLRSLAEEPALARTCMVESFAAGPRAIARRELLHRRFVDLVAAALDASSRADRFLCEALVAAISSMVTMRIGTGAIDELPGLREPIMELAGRLIGSGEPA